MNAYNDHTRLQSESLNYPDPDSADLDLEPNSRSVALFPSSVSAQTRTSDIASPEDIQEEDAHDALTSQSLNTDGTPKRPMNAFMIFARRRRPQVSAANQMMRTGEISKILSKEWNSMAMSDKQFYLDQAKKLKENFNSRYPDYVYRRRPNNSRKRRRTGSSDSTYSRGGNGEPDDNDSGDHGETSPDTTTGTTTTTDHHQHPQQQQQQQQHYHHHASSRPLRSPDSILSPHIPCALPESQYTAPVFGNTQPSSSNPAPHELLSLEAHSPHALSYPERFNQLAWPPLNHRGATTAAAASASSATPRGSVGPLSLSLSLSSPLHSDQLIESSSTPWAGSVPKLDPLKIDPGRTPSWYMHSGSGSGPDNILANRNRSLSNLHSATKSEPYTPTTLQRPWSSSTSSGSSDTNSSHRQSDLSTISPDFDQLGGGGGPSGFYPSPTSAPAHVQSPGQYFASSSGPGSGHLGSLGLHSTQSSSPSAGTGTGGSTTQGTRLGTESYETESYLSSPSPHHQHHPHHHPHHHHHHHTHSSPLSVASILGPNYVPAPSSSSSSSRSQIMPFDPLGPAPRSQAQMGTDLSAPYSDIPHSHGLSTSPPNDEPRSALGTQDFPWDGRSEAP